MSHRVSHRELRIPHADIQDPQTVTEVNEAAFARAGLNMHHDEVDSLVEDYGRRERILKVRAPRTYIDLGRKGR